MWRAERRVHWITSRAARSFPAVNTSSPIAPRNWSSHRYDGENTSSVKAFVACVEVVIYNICCWTPCWYAIMVLDESFHIIHISMYMCRYFTHVDARLLVGKLYMSSTHYQCYCSMLLRNLMPCYKNIICHPKLFRTVLQYFHAYRFTRINVFSVLLPYIIFSDPFNVIQRQHIPYTAF